MFFRPKHWALVRGGRARACRWQRTRVITVSQRPEAEEAVNAGTQGEADQPIRGQNWGQSTNHRPANFCCLPGLNIFSVNNKKYWKRVLFDWVWVRVNNALLLLCNMFALDRCGMGEILDCLKKIKLDINSLKTRVEELSDYQNRSFNKTETEKKENDEIIKTLTKKIDNVKQIVEPIGDEYIRKRSVCHSWIQISILVVYYS